MADLEINPWLHAETSMSLTPDLSKVADLAHWGGRLLRQRALPLLVANAVFLGGALALAVQAVAGAWPRLGRRVRHPPGAAPAD